MREIETHTERPTEVNRKYTGKLGNFLFEQKFLLIIYTHINRPKGRTKWSSRYTISDKLCVWFVNSPIQMIYRTEIYRISVSFIQLIYSRANYIAH